MIIIFGGNFAPRNWALCNGQLMAINQNTALFSLLGTTYGGNGTTTFALPDLRGRAALHFGQGPGLAALGEELIDLQLRAQRREWQARFPGSTDEVILLDGRPVGRIWVAWEPDTCVLVDMALLPEHRRSGIGGRIVGDVLAEAD